jgi:hypothetical protein
MKRFDECRIMSHANAFSVLYTSRVMRAKGVMWQVCDKRDKRDSYVCHA